MMLLAITPNRRKKIYKPPDLQNERDFIATLSMCIMKAYIEILDRDTPTQFEILMLTHLTPRLLTTVILACSVEKPILLYI